MADAVAGLADGAEATGMIFAPLEQVRLPNLMALADRPGLLFARQANPMWSGWRRGRQ